MAGVKINTDLVSATATKISGLNNEMRAGFNDVQNAIKKLDSAWDGAAATSAMNKFNAIKNAYCDARYNVVNNYVTFLRQQIDAGYVQTEQVNTSLADQFE